MSLQYIQYIYTPNGTQSGSWNPSIPTNEVNIKEIGIQGIPGTEIIFNDLSDGVKLGLTGTFSLNLINTEGIIKYFRINNLEIYNNTGKNLIIDTIQEMGDQNNVS